MLETFRKHHYVLMLIIAIVVVISFTFLSKNPDHGGPAGGTQRVFTLYNKDVSINDLQAIGSQMRIAAELGSLGGREDNPVSTFHQSMNSVVNTATPLSRDDMDVDYPKNVLVMRHEAEKLGIDVEKEDIKNFVRELSVFQTNGGFDATKLRDFLSTGRYGDVQSTETKLYTTLRDVMIFGRLSQLIGGTYAPSKAEVEADYATKHQQVTAATVLVEKKAYENQTVSDEEIQKFYDGEKTKDEKAKADAAAAAAEKKPAPAPSGADPLLLSEEKRTVKYILTTSPIAPVQPGNPPQAPTAVPPLGDLGPLAPEIKAAKEAEHKKKEEEFQKLQEAYTKANADYQKQVTDYPTKQADHVTARKEWLMAARALSAALNAEDRGSKSFEDVAKGLKFEVKTATFTKTTIPDDLKKIPSAGQRIFTTPVGAPEGDALADNAQGTNAFISIASVEPASVLPLDQVKQKISDKLKQEKIAAAMKAAADSARSNMLEALKAGKSFKDAATASMLTATELPAFSEEKPLVGVPHGPIVSQQTGSLNPGEISQPANVPEGLLLVTVEKKELPKHPDMDKQKKDLAVAHTVSGAIEALRLTPGHEEEAREKYFHFNKQGAVIFTSQMAPPVVINPLFQAWFTQCRGNAEDVSK